ncbi:MAG: amidohydrolase family protein [Phycisphaerales bacterium]
MGGVNEGGQAVTAECRIHDSLDPGAIGFYRQLAGGTTTVNSLHGSANPIGGQNAVHKIRWGAKAPDDMLLAGAKPGIKFALGENVKQSNWQNDRSRYPQTRMGVETLIRDRFTAAREYAAAMNTPELASLREQLRKLEASRDELARIRKEHPSVPDRPELHKQIDLVQAKLRAATPRRDLELETLAQILAGDRLIHCHSYRQDEILMLCRVAEDFGFKIGTFQHGLEVYKVAEAVRDHAIGASLFSDWWAYKVEVQDAIPYAGPIETEVGVLTSYNSDSDELARRLNTEAAKAVKYSDGRITPEEALKFVTINPAKQLMIDDHVGSLERGKDADVVVWSGDPLSVYSKPEHVYVDGRELFSLELDAQLREHNRAERQRLIQKILAAPDRPEDKAKKHGDTDDKPTDPVGTDAPPSLLARVMQATQDPNQPTICNCNIRGCAEDEKSPPPPRPRRGVPATRAGGSLPPSPPPGEEGRVRGYLLHPLQDRQTPDTFRSMTP